MPSWIQDPDTGELIPREEYMAHKYNDKIDTHYVQGDIESFVSPIDKSVISDRGKLRRHMKQHGVTMQSDYGKDYWEKANKRRNEIMTGTHPSCKKERIETLKEAYERFSNQ